MTIPTVSWDETAPAGGTDISLGDNRIREMKTQIREVIEVDHNYASSGQDAQNGKHKKVSLIEQADLGTGASGKPILGAQTVSSVPELVYTTEDDVDVQITTAGKINTAALKTTANTDVANILTHAYPVGSVYTSVLSTNPATALGFGTWSAFASGRCLVGLDSGQTEFDTVEETGGAKTVTLDTTMIPAHTHNMNAANHNGWGGSAQFVQGSESTNQGSDIITESTGGGAAHNNLPPYIVVYFFKRTA